MPTAQLNGVRLHYYRRPGFPFLVLIHGLATSLAFWYLRVLPALRRDLGVLLFDLRGHGRSDMPPSGYTTADMATDLHALLEHLGVEKAHLVGHSYGGAVALHYTTRYPERVQSLTLADARVRCFQPSQRIKDWPQAAMWEREARAIGVSDTDDPEMGYRFLEALAESTVTGASHPERAGIVHEARPMARFSPFGLSRGRNTTAERWLRLLRTTSARSDFGVLSGLTAECVHGVRQPTLAIFGEQSHCLLSYRKLQENLSNCKGILVPGAGHFHPVVRPLFFARTVSRFIESVSAGTGQGGR